MKANKEPSSSVGISIGASKESIKEAKCAILDILQSGAEQKTIRLALGVLKGACSVNYATVTNCNVTMKD